MISVSGALWASRGPMLWRSHCQDQQVSPVSPHALHRAGGDGRDTVGGCCLEKARVSWTPKDSIGMLCPVSKQCFCKSITSSLLHSLQDSTHPPRLSEGSPLGKASSFLHQSFLFPPHSGPFSTFEITLSKLPLGYIWVVRMMVSPA